MKFSDHKFRFSSTGKPLATFFKQRKVMAERYFPLTCKAEMLFEKGRKVRKAALKLKVDQLKTTEYVEKYYEYNRKAQLVAFVGC